MEKILLISDTHSNYKFLRDILLEEEDCKTIFHLGDNYEDIDNCSDLNGDKKILRVPGIFHKGYRNRTIDAIQIHKSFNWKLLLVHDINDAAGKFHDIDVFLHGHTHKPDFVKHHGKYYFNPGHLKHSKDRGSTASYAILEVDEKSIKFIVKNYKGSVIDNIIIKK